MTALDAKNADPMTERDFLSRVTKSAEAGDKTAKRVVEQADSWREMPFVREENGNAMIEWPPVWVKGENQDLTLGTCRGGGRT
jgi:hypothetical protein